MSEISRSASGKPEPPADVPITANSTITSASYLGISQAVKLVITTVSTIVIARILSPDDYGVMAMVGPVVAFIAMFQNLGLSTAAIQVRTLSSSQSNALFWINVFASTLLALLLIAAAPAVAWFYEDVRAGYVTAASAVAMVVGGLSIQHYALLQRQMRFGALSTMEISSTLAGFLVSLGLAVALQNYWALFFGALAGSLIRASVAWRLSSFRPSLKPTIKGVGDLVRFGGNLTASNLFDFVIRNADTVLIAKSAGARELGLYDRSYRLMMLPIHSINQPLSRLLLPILSRLNDDGKRYRKAFLLVTRGMMLLSAPGIAIATTLSHDLMPFLLGEQWRGAGPIFFWLGLMGLIQPVANLTGSLYISSGRPRALMWWTMVSAIFTLAAFILALPWGAVGIAFALFASAGLRLPLTFFLAARGISVKQSDLWGAQIEPLIGCAAAAAVAIALRDVVPLPVNMLITLPLAYVCAFLTSCISKDGRYFTIESKRLLFKFVSEKVHRRRRSRN